MTVLRQKQPFYGYSLTDTVEYNLQRWLEYGLIEIGAYTTTASGMDGYELMRTSDNRYTDGRVYEGLGPNFIWEDSIAAPSGMDAPIRASGVIVNDAFYDTDSTTGTYAHIMDFRSGRVIFDSAIPSTDTVECEYSFPDVAIYLSNMPQWRVIVDDYLNQFNTLATDQPTGLASILKSKRVWLPCVVIQAPDRGHRALQLGGGEIAQIRCIFHVFSDLPSSCNMLTDLIQDQVRKKIKLFDTNEAPFAFNENGTLVASPMDYIEIRDDYPLFNSFFTDSDSRFIKNSGGVFRGEVRLILEVEREDF